MVTVAQCRRFVAGLCAMALIGVVLEVQPVYSDDLPNPRIKRIYTDEDAPPEIRFMNLLQMLTVNIDGTRDRATRRLGMMGFDSEDIPRVRTYLESLNDEARAEIDEGIWRLACHGDASSLGFLEIRVVYNSFDDLRYAVFAKYLAIASAELANTGYADFLYMIDGYPGSGASFRVMSTDHRYAWGDTNDRIQQNRAEMCHSLGERLGK